MKRITLLLTLVSAMPCFGQAWSGILSSSRAIDWTKAGLPGTITYGSGGSTCSNTSANCTETTTNQWTPPTTRVQCGSTISAGASAATINTALAACLPGSYVLLGAGNFTTSGTSIAMYNMAGITLRGSGANSTFLTVTSGDIIAIGGSNGSFTGTLSGTLTAGTTSITMTGATGTPVVGQVMTISQCDTGSGTQPCATTPADNGSLFVCGENIICNTDGGSQTDFSHQAQTVIATAVTNNGGGSFTMTISPGLYMPNWSTSHGAIIAWQNAPYDAVGMALEDMSIIAGSGINSGNFLAQIQHGYGSWFKGLRFIGDGASADLALTSNNIDCLVLNNYFAPGATLSSTFPYGLFGSANTGVLVLNNIFAQGLPIEYQGQNVGLVTAYNFARDGFTQYPENVLSFDHFIYSSFDLWEGNQASAYTEDNIWGTHDLNTYFRNNIQCNDYPYTGYTLGSYRGLAINALQRFENAIGNALGTNTTLCGTYQGTGNDVFQIDTSDSLVASTLMRWGNVSIVQQGTDTPANSGVRFVSSEVPSSLSSPNTPWQNSVPANDNLPCSFFVSGTSFTTSPCSIFHGGTGLSWWKVCKTWSTFPTSCSATQTQPFPTSGPDQTGGNFVNGYSYDNPAAVAWINLPIDTTYQNSYTVSSSSWASGVETLTFAGGVLPNFQHLIGPFQLSGVAVGCTTGATFGNNSEILMTSSSTSTNQVQYALASNPGTNACAGTNAFKFPDVRQFDERVFETDPSSCTVSFSPPAGTYSGTQTVTLSTSGCPAGTTIFYRTDGKPATNIDTQYSSPITVSSTQTLTVKAVLNPTVRDQPWTLSTQKKCNAVGSPITFPSGYTCSNGSGGVAGTASDFNFISGSSQMFVSTTDSTDFDTSVLIIDTPTTTDDNIVNMSQRIKYQDTSNCSQTSPNFFKCVDVSEWDMESCCDATTHALWQMSSKCSTNATGSSGNSGFLEGDASSGTEKWDIPCDISAQNDVTVNSHWTLGDTACGGAGCMVLDSIYLNGTQYNFPASCDAGDTNCPNYPMTAQPSFSHFIGGSQQQPYARNVTTAGTSPLTTTRNISFSRVVVDEGTEATSSALFTITSPATSNATLGSGVKLGAGAQVP